MNNTYQELHREKLRTMKPSIDTEEPKCLRLDHIRNNLKREQLLEERYGEIDRENRILLQKMSNIMRNPQFSLTKQVPTRGPASLNKVGADACGRGGVDQFSLAIVLLFSCVVLS